MSAVVPAKAGQGAKTQQLGAGENAYGRFSPDGAEYHIRDAAPPRPWVNVISNPRLGLVVSQTGSGFTWIDNSQLAVITRWQQEFAQDASGRFLYVRDEETGKVWSLAPAPTFPKYDEYVCKHGVGYTVFETQFDGIAARWTLFCDSQETVEYWHVELHNVSGRPRKLALCSYLEWNCGVAPSPRREFHKLFVETEYDAGRHAVVARNRMWDVPNGEHGHWNTTFPYVSAFGCTLPIADAQGDKAAFFGRNGEVRSPAALAEETWEGRFGQHEDAVAALRSRVALKAGEQLACGYVLAVSEREEETQALMERGLNEARMRERLEAVRVAWRRRLDAHRVDTPEEGVNFLANDWLRYQAISGRLWGRCGYYQQSGAWGFRDQLQDSQVWLSTQPARCRKQINLHAAHQFADGSVYHWWHPLSEQGHRTEMTDDLLWLAFVTASYIRETGDLSVLEDAAPFVDDETAVPLKEHVRRAFERVFGRMSPRGLPYIGAGDWNDGLSAAGLGERGESIWLGHFLAGILGDWVEVCRRSGDAVSAEAYGLRRAALVKAINAHGWDGGWYRRATLDSGRLLGSAECAVGKIFLNAQTWAVLNDVAPPARAAQCMAAVKEHLVKEVGALLLTPAFDKPDAEVGYITRYAPGLRENGGVYTHAATWAIAAACKVKDAALVEQLLGAINPTNKDPERYWAEPYVLPGNVDGPESPYFGRGGWTWYTGSAAWLHRVICEWVLGVRPTWEGLLMDPCLPRGWREASMLRSWRGNRYDIRIERHGDGDGTPAVVLDGKRLERNVISPSTGTGATHTVLVRID
jgi:cellobiose phosphorylase